jgi:hypothetical protein
MQRLQVRSLDGLDYREALDLLRRQLLDDAAPAPAPARAAAAPPPPTASASPRAEPAPYRFDEEDDYDITIALAEGAEDGDNGDDYAGAMDGLADSASDGMMDDLDDLPDVPDLDAAPLPPPTARRAAPAATRAATESATPESATPESATPESAAPPVPERGRELLEHFRGITPGSAATPDQIKAYTNLIVGQLDATQAGTLVRGIWGAAPNRIGSDQLYALIRWGKEDAFAEEAPAVLAAIKAEAASKGGTPAHANGADHDTAPPARPSRPARAPRAGGDAGGGDD